MEKVEKEKFAVSFPCHKCKGGRISTNVPPRKDLTKLSRIKCSWTYDLKYSVFPGQTILEIFPEISSNDISDPY